MTGTIQVVRVRRGALDIDRDVVWIVADDEGRGSVVPADAVIELTEERSGIAKHNDPNRQLASRRFVSEWEATDERG